MGFKEFSCQTAHHARCYFSSWEKRCWGTWHRHKQHPWVAPGSTAGGMGKLRHGAGTWAAHGGHCPVSLQLAEGNAGTEGGSQAQELILGAAKASSGLERALGDTAPGPPHCPPRLQAIFPS